MSDIEERVLEYVNGLDVKGDLVDYTVYDDGRINIVVNFGILGSPKHRLTVNELPEVKKATRRKSTSKSSAKSTTKSSKSESG